MSQQDKIGQNRKTVLFVDDEPTMLEVYRMIFKTLNDDWELHFASSGQDALTQMKHQSFAVIVADMRMPGMNGAQLLTEVLKESPRTARIILSGYAEQEAVAKCVGAAHQFLLKPCDVMTLRSTLSRVLALDVFLENERLKSLVAQMGSLPSVPSLYFKIIQELQSPGATVDGIGEIIAMDPAMTAKLLQLVNSAFFGISRKISNISEAVQFLGVNTVRSLALTIHAFSCFQTNAFPEFSFDRLWNHSMTVGTFAKKITQAETADRAMIDESFIAGLLHDVGKLMLAANLASQYKEAFAMARERKIPLIDAEHAVFGATHADVGAYLLGLWGLPIPIVEAVALHHRPVRQTEEAISPLAAVHAANFLEHESFGDLAASCAEGLNTGYLASLGLVDHVQDWRDAFKEIAGHRAEAA
jgi:HD-like signal output (HDOD) protein/ActR/RegA family two-component response regulator